MRYLPVLLLLSTSVNAAEFKPFDYQREPTNLQIEIKELKGAKPSFAQRRPEGTEAGQSQTIETGQDSIDFHANGVTAWFEYQYSTKSPHLIWPAVDLDKHITSYKWFAQATMQGTQSPYSRSPAQGVYRLFTYKPPQGERWCVAGTMAHSQPHNAERVTAIVCKPPGKTMTAEDGKKILDAIGTKAIAPSAT